jgi:hypothetical protein
MQSERHVKRSVRRRRISTRGRDSGARQSPPDRQHPDACAQFVDCYDRTGVDGYSVIDERRGGAARSRGSGEHGRGWATSAAFGRLRGPMFIIELTYKVDLSEIDAHMTFWRGSNMSRMPPWPTANGSKRPRARPKTDRKQISTQRCRSLPGTRTYQRFEARPSFGNTGGFRVSTAPATMFQPTSANLSG